MWERPTEDDMMRCGGCGSLDCDEECPQASEMYQKVWADEARGIFLPSYCPVTNRKFCTKCGMIWEAESALCDSCGVLYPRVPDPSSS